MKIIFVSLVGCFISLSCFSQDAEIAKTFTTYQDAIDQSPAKGITPLLSEATISYYNRILGIARTGDFNAVTNLNLADKLVVLLFRQYLEVDQLQNFNTDSVLIFAVKVKMIDEEIVNGRQLQNIHIEADHASAEATSPDGVSSDSVFFALESQVWKIDLMPALSSTRKMLTEMLAESNTSEKLFVEGLVENITGKPLKSNLWSPPE